LKRYIFLVLIFFLLQYSYSQETLVDGSFRFLTSHAEGPQATGYLNFSYGKYFPVVPDIIFFGVSFEAGLGLDWVYLISLFTGNNESAYGKNDPKKNDYEFGFQLGTNYGLRLFSLLEIGIADFNIFIGYNVSLLIIDINSGDYGFIQNPIVGASITFRLGGRSGNPMGLGLEYAYYIPTPFSKGMAFHHFALVFRLMSTWD
jgi:hypothetical protein